jgi:hypothetical protein
VRSVFQRVHLVFALAEFFYHFELQAFWFFLCAEFHLSSIFESFFRFQARGFFLFGSAKTFWLGQGEVLFRLLCELNGGNNYVFDFSDLTHIRTLNRFHG